MKILFATYESISIQKGGPKTQLLQTKLELEKLGIQIDLFSPWDKINLNDYTFVHLFSANLSTYNIARNFFNSKIPIVVSTIFFTQRKYSFVKHLISIENIIKKVKPGFYTDFGITKQICDWSRLILPNTIDENNLIQNGLSQPSNKTFVIPNGVSKRFLDADKNIFFNKYGLTDFILNVGHIGPTRKNLLNLILALQKINHPSVIIGRSDNSEYAKRCIYEASKSKNITLIDYMDNDSEMLASAYKCAKVFALPSLYETPGIAALEAGLAGAKIVITPFGGTKDYFENFASYTNPFNVEEIKNAIETKLNESENNLLQTHILNNFLWEHVAQKTLNAYKAVF